MQPNSSTLPAPPPLPPLTTGLAAHLLSREQLEKLVTISADLNLEVRECLFRLAGPIQASEHLRRIACRQRYVLDVNAVRRLVGLAMEGKRSDEVDHAERLYGPTQEDRPVAVVLEQLAGEISRAAFAEGRFRDGVRALLRTDNGTTPLQAISTAQRSVKAATRDATVRAMLARRYEGHFSPHIPWSDIWQGDLYQLWPSAFGMDSPPDLPFRLNPSLPTPRSSTLLASLPSELVRLILHQGAQSLLPTINLTARDADAMYKARSQFLLTASLVCRAWRAEAQAELVSDAQCTTAEGMLGLDTFLAKTRQRSSLRRLRIGKARIFREGQDDELWKAAQALLVRCAGLREISLGNVVLDTEDIYRLQDLKCASLSFFHWRPRFFFELPVSTTSLALINCTFDAIGEMALAYQDPPQRLPVLLSTDKIQHLTILASTIRYHCCHLLPVPSLALLPHVTSLLLDTSSAAQQLLQSPLPTVTTCEFVSDFLRPDGIVVDTTATAAHLVLELPGLRTLKVPCDKWWKDQRGWLEEACSRKEVELVGRARRGGGRR